MNIAFDIFNREFFRKLTFSLKFQKKTQVSIIYIKNIVFLLPFHTTGTRSVMQEEYYTQFHSNGQNVLAIEDSRSGYHVHQINGVNGNREHEKKIKEIPLLIDFVSLIILHYSYLICFPDLTLKSLVKFFMFPIAI